MIARTCVQRPEGASGSAWSRLATSWLVPWRGSGYAGASRGIPLGISVTDLEIEEAIREAWAVLSAGLAVSPVGAPAGGGAAGGDRRHASPSALDRPRWPMARPAGRPRRPGAWLASWGPRPGEPGCQVPLAVLPETQTRYENAYALWRSTARASTDVDSESKTAGQPRS